MVDRSVLALFVLLRRLSRLGATLFYDLFRLNLNDFYLWRLICWFVRVVSGSMHHAVSVAQ